MPQLTRQSHLRVPAHTQIAYVNDELVISNATGSKTLSGEHVTVVTAILEQCDGCTELGTIADQVDDKEAALAVAEVLCEQDIVYPMEYLSPFDLDDRHRSLFETVLLSLDTAERHSFAVTVRDTTIEMRGDQVVTKKLVDQLQCIEWNVTTETTDSEPDVMVFIETDATRAIKRETVNEDWLDSDAVLIRFGTFGTAVEVGPVLTPCSRACLKCLTTRREMNNATSDFEYDTIQQSLPYGTEFIEQTLTRLICQATFELIPAPLVGQLVSIDLSTLNQHRGNLLGIPGCEACGTNY